MLVLRLCLHIKSDRVGALSLLSSVVAFCGVVSDCELLPELAPGANRVSSLVAMMTLHVGCPFVMQLGRHFRNNTTNNARIMLNALAYLLCS